MLKKIKNKNPELLSSDDLQKFKNLPKSEKIYFHSKKFKDVKVGMRKILL